MSKKVSKQYAALKKQRDVLIEARVADAKTMARLESEIKTNRSGIAGLRGSLARSQRTVSELCAELCRYRRLTERVHQELADHVAAEEGLRRLTEPQPDQCAVEAPNAKPHV